MESSLSMLEKRCSLDTRLRGVCLHIILERILNPQFAEECAVAVLAGRRQNERRGNPAHFVSLHPVSQAPGSSFSRTG